jgi:hypothetical protein
MRMACSSGVSGSEAPWIRLSQSSVPSRRRREPRRGACGCGSLSRRNEASRPASASSMEIAASVLVRSEPRSCHTLSRTCRSSSRSPRQREMRRSLPSLSAIAGCGWKSSVIFSRRGRGAPGAVPKRLLHHRAARAARLGGDLLVRPRILTPVLAYISPSRDLSRLFRREEAAVDERDASEHAILCPTVRDAPIERHELLAEPPRVISVARHPIDLLPLAQELLVDGALGRVLVAIPGPRHSAGEEQHQHEGDRNQAGPGQDPSDVR